LPEGAKAGLKDATQEMQLGTEEMNKQLNDSLPIHIKDQAEIKNTGKSKPSKKQGLVNKATPLQDKGGKKKEPLNEAERNMMLKKLNQNSGTNQSQTTSIMEMQNKLQEVMSPSSSKPDDDDDYFQEEDDVNFDGEEGSRSDISQSSIPMAHREYEKILRQLEAECRTHIKCEQQMKLHIECLQEKLDQIMKDNEATLKEHEEEKKKIQEDLKKEIDTLSKSIKKLELDMHKNVEKLKRAESQRDMAQTELK